MNQILDSDQLITQDDFKKFKKIGLIKESIGFSEIKSKIYKRGNTFLFKNIQYTTKDDTQDFILDFEAFINSDCKFEILFNKCTFYTSNEIKNKTIKQKILFKDCRGYGFNFDECTFENKVQFLGSGGGFNRCTFKDDLSFSGANLVFPDCVFNKKSDFTLYESNNSNNNSISLNFSNTKFYSAVDFKTNFVVKADFSNCIFDKEVKFDKLKFQNVNFKNSTFNGGVSFTHAKFYKIPNSNNTKFKKEINSDELKFQNTNFENVIFNKNVSFSHTEFHDAPNFNNTKFKKSANFDKTFFAQEATFGDADFCSEANFYNATFKSEANFKSNNREVSFNRADFSNATFESSAYFNNRTFSDFTNFHEAKFKDTACFYNVKFNCPMNFSSCIFGSNLNLINCKANFSYRSLQDLVCKQSQDKYEKIKFINNLRDGFRLIKYTLNSVGSNLDAAIFHRNELYCKEIEIENNLEYSPQQKMQTKKEIKHKRNFKQCALILIGILFKTISAPFLILSFFTVCMAIFLLFLLPLTLDILRFLWHLVIYNFPSFLRLYFKSKNPQKNKPQNINYEIRELMDLLTLKVYRITSDHHTNLVGITNFFVSCVSIYWLSILIYTKLILPLILNLSSFALFSLLYSIPIILLPFFILNAKSGWTDKFFGILIMGISLLTLPPFIVTAYSVVFIIAYLTLFAFYFFIFYKNNITSFAFKFISYGIFLLALFTKPVLITPFIGVFQTNLSESNQFKNYALEQNLTAPDEILALYNQNIHIKKDNVDSKIDFIIKNRTNIIATIENKNLNNEVVNFLKFDEYLDITLKTSNLVYGFLMLLVLYSLAKTARKNSIIPS